MDSSMIDSVLSKSTYTRNESAEVVAELSRILSPDSDLTHNQLLAKKTTLRVGGPADCFVKPASESDLCKTVAFCLNNRIPWTVIGRGSNLLIRDGGIAGVVIQLSKPNFQYIHVSSDNPLHLICGAGARLKNIANFARDASLAGFEFLEGIPGVLGGALRMNAGAMGSEIFNLVHSVRVLQPNTEIVDLSVDQISYRYRSCAMLSRGIAVGATLAGVAGSRDDIEEKMKSSNAKRWSSQPTAPSAGCTFKNPDTIPAGKLIDQLGLKGLAVGDASVSDVHGNFIINNGGASASEFLNLIEKIRSSARLNHGIELETEIQIIGEPQ